MSYLLLAAVVFAWGFSWYAITLQVGEAPALVALTYRFVLSAGVMCFGLFVTRRWRFIPWKDQPLLMALGFCLFSMNFLSFYFAALHLPSGLLSVIFSTAAILGAINVWLFFGNKVEGRVVFATLLGIGGLALLLMPEVDTQSAAAAPWWAIALPFVGTYCFSIGNIVSARLSKDYDLMNIVGQGMFWGALWLTILCFAFDQEFVLPASTLFWAGVVYLALIASLLAFLTYLSLVNRIGTARASYATVLFPIVAMIVSTYAEGYEWTLSAFVGLAMALGGTVLVFAGRGKN